MKVKLVLDDRERTDFNRCKTKLAALKRENSALKETLSNVLNLINNNVNFNSIRFSSLEKRVKRKKIGNKVPFGCRKEKQMMYSRSSQAASRSSTSSDDIQMDNDIDSEQQSNDSSIYFTANSSPSSIGEEIWHDAPMDAIETDVQMANADNHEIICHNESRSPLNMDVCLESTFYQSGKLHSKNIVHLISPRVFCLFIKS